MARAFSYASATVVATSLGRVGSPVAVQSSLKSSRSSARSIASKPVPRISHLHSPSTPFLASCMARLSPVWPPRVGRSASGRSLRMMRATNSSVSGSM